MGTCQYARQSPFAVSTPIFSDPPQGIALFDLDGTLIAWDCQLLFRHFVLRREPWRGVFLPVFLGLVPFAWWLGTERMKRIFLSYLWRMEAGKLEDYSKAFAASLMPAIYPALKDQLERHRAAGHWLILSSASPEFYVVEIGRALGFDLSLGTPVAPGPLFPPLTNHKGAAKVARLNALLPPAWFQHGKLVNSHGYTDSRADLPMLTLCDTATVVNPSPRLAELAAHAGWDVVRPTRPWKSRAGWAMRGLAMLTGLGHDPAGISHPPS
ncbi:MAG: hypothetical protein RLZZ282_1448 [Verrucomicrobiota bacterium]